MKTSFSVILFIVILFSTGCESCRQPAEARWTIINDTNQDHTLEFDIETENNGTPLKTFTIESNSSVSAVVNSYTYTKTPNYRGKLGPKFDYPKCTSTPELQYSNIQLHDESTTLKLCFKWWGAYTVYIVDIAATCPTDTYEHDRWED